MNNTARPGWATPSATAPPAWVKALAVLAGVTAAAWATWCSVIALIGGTLPLSGYRTDGDVLTFLLMLFVGVPVLITLAYWAFVLVMLPITLLAARRSDS